MKRLSRTLKSNKIIYLSKSPVMSGAFDLWYNDFVTFYPSLLAHERRKDPATLAGSFVVRRLLFFEDKQFVAFGFVFSGSGAGLYNNIVLGKPKEFERF